MKVFGNFLLLIIFAKILADKDILSCLSVKMATEKLCTSMSNSNSGYKCCYITKTEKESGNDISTCARIFNDESSLNIYRRRYSDDYKNITIQCSSGYLMISLFILIALFC